MGKNRRRQEHRDVIQGLSLGFVDSYGEGQHNWELSASEFERKQPFLGTHGYPRDMNDITFVLAADNASDDHEMTLDVDDDQPCPVTKAFVRC